MNEGALVYCFYNVSSFFFTMKYAAKESVRLGLLEVG